MKSCPACKSEYTTAYKQHQWSFWGIEYSLLICENCKTIFTDPLPSNDVLKRIYAECFDYRWYQDHYTAKYRDCAARVEEYRLWLGQRVLDFGGGVGYLSEALRAKGYESQTYDPYCTIGDKMESGWDTIIALHVLEHSNDPDCTIAQIKSLLNSDGTLILAVPNAAGKGYRKLDTQWVWMQPPLVHVLHFTKKGLCTLLERNGFVINEVRFAERWDANLYCDLERAEQFQLLGSLWGRQPFSRLGLYRKLCASYESNLRNNGLQKAINKTSTDSEDFSELQIIAKLVAQ